MTAVHCSQWFLWQEAGSKCGKAIWQQWNQTNRPDLLSGNQQWIGLREKGPPTNYSQDVINENDEWAWVPAKIITPSLFQPRFPHTDKMSPMTFGFGLVAGWLWKEPFCNILTRQQSSNKAQHLMTNVQGIHRGLYSSTGVGVARGLPAERGERARGLSQSKDSSLLCWEGSIREVNLKWPDFWFSLRSGSSGYGARFRELVWWEKQIMIHGSNHQIKHQFHNPCNYLQKRLQVDLTILIHYNTS